MRDWFCFFNQRSRFYARGSDSGGRVAVHIGILATPSPRWSAARSPLSAGLGFGRSTLAIHRQHRPQLVPAVFGRCSNPSFTVCWLISSERVHAIGESCARQRLLRLIISRVSSRMEAMPSTSRRFSRPQTELIARSSSFGSEASSGSRCKQPPGSPRRPAGSDGVGSFGACNPRSKADLAISSRTLSRRDSGSD